ncbi:hypothetical protein SNEBB_003337, partial [Seison nebaliae]
MIPMGYKS